MTTRDDFAATLAEFRALPEKHAAEREALNNEYRARIIEAARPLYRRKKRPLDYVEAARLVGDDAEKLTKDLHERAQATMKAQDAAKKALSAKLDTLAETAEIRSGEFWVAFSEHYVSSYYTQGYGAASYAHNGAKLDALVPQHFGIETVVVKSDGLPSPAFLGGGRICESYVTACKVESDVDVEVMKRRPALSLRDWLKACWKHAANPRVFNPFLPEGLEAKLGIDYQGNDVKAKTA